MDPQTGDVCGTCGGHACLHSPHYGTSWDQPPSKCDMGNMCFEWDFLSLHTDITNKETTYAFLGYRDGSYLATNLF